MINCSSFILHIIHWLQSPWFVYLFANRVFLPFWCMSDAARLLWQGRSRLNRWRWRWNNRCSSTRWTCGNIWRWAGILGSRHNVCEMMAWVLYLGTSRCLTWGFHGRQVCRPGNCSGTVTVFIGVGNPGFTAVSILTDGDVTGFNKEDDGWCIPF
jgi:hypothetical protein